MNIQGPGGPPPVDNEPRTVVTPGLASAATKSPAQAPAPSVQLQLSPAMFKQGQILQVVIAKMEQDALLLLLQNRLTDNKGEPLQIQFRVPAFPGAQQGQQLSVQVIDIKNNLPVLRLMAVNPATTQEITSASKQHSVPTQPLQAVFDHLTTARTNESVNTALPNVVREQLDRLWRTIPEATLLQRTEKLQQALKYAGPFLEAQLAKIATSNERAFPAMDVRAQLLRLAQTIRQQVTQPTNPPASASPATTSTTQATPLTLPVTSTNTVATTTTLQTGAAEQTVKAQTATQPQNVPNVPHRQLPQYDGLPVEKILQQLLQQTDAGLARIQQHQLQMLPGEARPQWIIELPLKTANGIDVFDLRIQPDGEQKENQRHDPQYPWTVMLAFNLDGLGPIRAQISLYQGRISTYWWAEQQHTVSLFSQHRSFLENRLQHAGVPFHQLVCERGIPEAKMTTNRIPYSDSNLDESV